MEPCHSRSEWTQRAAPPLVTAATKAITSATKFTCMRAITGSVSQRLEIAKARAPVKRN